MKRLLMILCIFTLAGCSPGQLLPGLSQTIVDWVDIIKWNDSTYTNENRTWETGAELGEIGFQMNGHAGPRYKMKNGDAAYLSPGTKIYELVGYDATFRIIADGRMFEVDEPGQANILGDFLDIEGKVESIRFIDHMDDSIVGHMSEDGTKQFIDELLLLPYTPYNPAIFNGNGPDGKAVFIEILLADGTLTRTSYWFDSKFIWYGAIATDRLEQLLQKELSAYDF